MSVRREITVTRKGLIRPIDIVQGTDLIPFEFVVTDFTIPLGAAVVAYNKTGSETTRKQVCDVIDNVITFTPDSTLFDEGKNVLQLRVTYEEKNLFSFEIIVNSSKAPETDDAEEVKKQPTLVAQLLTKIGNLFKAVADETTERKNADAAEESARKQAIAVEKSERQAEIAVERARIDNLTKMEEGSTTGDAELIDARISNDGVYYGSVGDAIRAQGIKKILSSNIFDKNTMAIVGSWYYLDGTGKAVLQTNNDTANYGAIKITNRGYKSICVNLELFRYYLTFNLYWYACVDKDFNILKSEITSFNMGNANSSSYVINDIPSGTSYILISLSNYLSIADSENDFIYVNAGNEKLPYEPYWEKNYIKNLESETIDKIRNDIVEAKKDITNIQNDIDEIKKEYSLLKLPSKYELVVNDTFELFYKGVINSVKAENFYVEAICDKGKAFKNRFIYTPIQSDIGEQILIIKLYNELNELVEEKSVILSIKNKVLSPTSEKVILYIGDSLAGNGYVPEEMFRRLAGNGGSPIADGLANIAFIGTQESVNTQIKYEGYGGYNFASYNTEHKLPSFTWITCANHGKTTNDQHSKYRDSNGNIWLLETIEEGRIKIIGDSITQSLPSENGILTWYSGGENRNNIQYAEYEIANGNPFWNIEKEMVDFNYYVSTQGKHKLDYVYVLLGWNDWGKEKEIFKNDVLEFVNNILTDFPNCKIVLLGLQVPSLDGNANNYGAVSQLHYKIMLANVWKVNEVYEEIAEEYANVSYVNVSGQFDTENNMPTDTRTVNVRSAKTETYQTNSVHPSYDGYMQIADACYRDFIHKLQG